jgi:hypothetical protein
VWQKNKRGEVAVRNAPKNSFRTFLTLLAGAVGVVFASSAQAAVVYDTSLIAPPGYYNGSGNPNEGFTVNLDNGIELGFGVQYRKTGPQVHPGTNSSVYQVNTGVYTGPPADFCSGVCALWNFEFSVNLRAATPNAGLTLADVNGLFTILNVANGQTLQFSPSIFPDNAGYNGATHPNATGADWGAQNSENLSFFSSPLLIGYGPTFGFNPLLDDTYIFTFTLTNQAGDPLGSLQATVIAGNGAATPLPAALPLFAGGLGVFGLIARRRKNKNKAVGALT